MEPQNCLTQLARLISTEASGLHELAGLLDGEHELLQSNDIEGLQGAMRERQRCIARVVRADEDRRSLCRNLGYEPDVQGLEQLMRWCDPTGTLAKDWAECASAAAACRQRNDRNGALVNARLQNVQGRLGVLVQGTRDQFTYGRRSAYNLVNVGRVVATEA
ncbi:MAG TPA: flagellar protein FlgN [Steroidobacteraceae bacterium]|nr:flagellar protein FlgN [Steroidobacteraceae bacterium]